MNFDDLKIADVGTLKLAHPLSGEIIEGAEIDLFGRDSKKFRSMVHEEARLAIAGQKVDPLEQEAKSLERCCLLTVAIRGIEIKGEPVTDPRRLYSEFPWIFEQVQSFILARRNFLKPA